MNLCKWTTNSPELKAKWLHGDFNFTLEPEAHGCVLKVLGLVWRPETDDFIFDLKHLMDLFKERENTKRSVLRSSAKIFDPMGFLTPFTIRVKCLFQEMWQGGIGTRSYQTTSLKGGSSGAWSCFSCTRWYGTEELQNGQGQVLHVFSDVSE